MKKYWYRTIFVLVSVARVGLAEAPPTGDSEVIASLEIAIGDEWHAISGTPTLSINDRSELRLCIQNSEPLPLSCFLVSHTGEIAQIWPIKRYRRAGPFPGVDEPFKQLVLYNEDIFQAYRRLAVRAEGEYAIVIVGGERQIPLDRLMKHLEPLSKSLRDVSTPGFLQVMNGRVLSRAYLTTSKNSGSAELSHANLCRTALSASSVMQKQCSYVVIMALGVMRRGTYDIERHDLYSRLLYQVRAAGGFLDNGDFVSAEASASLSRRLANDFYSAGMYKCGHPTKALVCELHGAALFHSKKYREAIEAFASARRTLAGMAAERAGVDDLTILQSVLLGSYASLKSAGQLAAANRYGYMLRHSSRQLLDAKAYEDNPRLLESIVAGECVSAQLRSSVGGGRELALRELYECRNLLQRLLDGSGRDDVALSRSVVAVSMLVGALSEEAGGLRESAESYEEAVFVVEASVGAHRPRERLECYISAGRAQLSLGRYVRAAELFRKARELVEVSCAGPISEAAQAILICPEMITPWPYGSGSVKAELKWREVRSYILDEILPEAELDAIKREDLIRLAGRAVEFDVEFSRWVLPRIERAIECQLREQKCMLLLMQLKQVQLANVKLAARTRSRPGSILAVSELLRVCREIVDVDIYLMPSVVEAMLESSSCLSEVGCHALSVDLFCRATAMLPDWPTRISDEISIRVYREHLLSCVAVNVPWRLPESWRHVIGRNAENVEALVAGVGLNEQVHFYQGHRNLSLACLRASRLGSIETSQIYSYVAKFKAGRMRPAGESRYGLGLPARDLRVEDPFSMSLLGSVEAHRTLYGTRPTWAGKGVSEEQSADATTRSRSMTSTTPTTSWLQLREGLGPRQALVDFYFVPGFAGQVGRYDAFVVQQGRPLIHVELGPAQPIHDAVLRWRTAILSDAQRAEGQAAAQEVSQRLWGPLSIAVAAEVDTLFICPDSLLALVPWAALPLGRGDQVLLERYALATVPYGDFLLRQVAAPQSPDAAQAARWLLLGGVDFDAAVGLPAAEPTARRWNPLPITRREVARIGQYLEGRPVVELTGAEATSQRLLEELPRVQFAHLATHGFFANPTQWAELGYVQTPQDELQRRSQVLAGLQSPYTLTGLVLAGANHPPARDAQGQPLSDGGLLTASSVAQLPLEQLRLAVLSACDTGNGRVAPGEGTLALSRAFHAAGAQNVVATLWPIDDEPTAALMNLFYHYLVVEQRPPLHALRQAQLDMRSTPQPIESLADVRGPNLRRITRTRQQQRPSPRAERQWAGFTLSGAGSWGE